MYELNVTVTKVLGKCTSDPPMAPGVSFTVRDGDIRIPEGGFVCIYALQSILPLITPKEREICEERDQDWLWRVHHAQCPDPDGRVILKIERVGRIETRDGEQGEGGGTGRQGDRRRREEGQGDRGTGGGGDLRDLRVVVEEVRGKCTSGLRPGDWFELRGGRLTIPAGRHFCLYALHAVLPLLPAKQRRLEDGDWLKGAAHVICPDPAGNVVMRMEVI